MQRTFSRFIRPALTSYYSSQKTAAVRQVPSTLFRRNFSNTINITFVEGEEGKPITVKGKIGESLLTIAHENDIEVEGACGGELACSTCHCILSPEIYAIVPPPSEEEEDMLDLAWGLTDTSRLGCQVIAAPELDGMKVIIPEESNDMSYDDE